MNLYTQSYTGPQYKDTHLSLFIGHRLASADYLYCMLHLLKLPMFENSTNSVACAGASLKHLQMKLYNVVTNLSPIFQ
jgi:hypothetical protein